MKKIKVICCGDREWDDQYRVAIHILELKAACVKAGKKLVIIHGDCRGADTMAGVAGHHLELEVRAYPADWKKHGKKAGPIRNSEMLKKENPDLVVGFHNNIEESKGTLDMLRKAAKAGKTVELVNKDGRVWIRKGRPNAKK